MSNTTGNYKIKEEHRRRVLSAIRRAAPVSRTDVSALTNVSKPTVTRIVDELLQEGLVVQTGVLEASSKKKPVGLALNADAYRCVGINISRNTLRAIVADFRMEVIGKQQRDIRGICSGEALIGAIGSSIDGLLAGAGRDRLLGIGIGVAGIVDHEGGILRDFAAMHRITGVPIRDKLQAIYGVPVFVDNDANTQALGEYWYGYAEGTGNSLFLSCREGIGSGIIADGRILRGGSNLTGEMGHMTIRLGGKPCTCGRRGCLETYCSAEAIEDEAREALARGRESILAKETGGDLDRVDYAAVTDCAARGDALCLHVLGEAADILAAGLASVLALLDSEVVTVSGELFDEGDLFFEMVRDRLKNHLLGPHARDIVLKKRRVDDNLYEIGAAAMVYRDFFGD